MVADCDQPKRPREGECCYNCESTDHYGKDCDQPKKERPDNRACHNCMQTGHLGKDCPQPRKTRAEREAMQEAAEAADFDAAPAKTNVS